MVAPNKLMMQLLQKLFKFECEDCQRYWSYEDYIMHNLQGRCVKAANADNNVADLNADQKPLTMEESVTRLEEARQAQQARQVSEFDLQGVSLDKIFTIDKDMRAVYCYNIKTNSIRNCKLDTP